MPAMSRILTLAIAAVLTFGVLDDASAARKKRPERATAPAIERDYDGTPIIMKGYRRPPPTSVMKDESGTGRVDDQPSKGAERARPRPRGSSGAYIPPPVPSPSASSLPAPVLVQPGPGVYQPPRINSFGDRVTDCIHSFPLNRGIGNNPTDQQAYIRQCAN
jgi:hypothetical protein